MKLRAVTSQIAAIGVIAGLAALPPAAGASATGAQANPKFPLAAVPQVQANGTRTLTAAVTMPYNGKYAHSIVTGRTLLCRARQVKLTAGRHKVACRVRAAAVKKLRSLLTGHATGSRAAQQDTAYVYVQSVVEYIVSHTDASATLEQIFGEPSVVIYQTQRSTVSD